MSEPGVPNVSAGFPPLERMEISRINRSRTGHWTVLACALIVLLVLGAEALRWSRAAHAAARPSMGSIGPAARATLTELSHTHIPAPQGMP